MSYSTRLSVVDCAPGSAGLSRWDRLFDVVRLRDSLEDSTASNPSLTCHRNDGQEHGLSTLYNINAILRSSRIAMTTEFLVPLAPVRHSCKENFGSTPGGSSSPHTFFAVTFTCCLTHSVRCDHELRPDWCYLTPCLRLSGGHYLGKPNIITNSNPFQWQLCNPSVRILFLASHSCTNILLLKLRHQSEPIF